ncbi:MAG: sodium:solute symporter family transporter [Bradymonadia bacterium]
MDPQVFAIGLCVVYALATYGLSIIGMRKTSSLKSFALGKGDMSPLLAGVTMSSSIASTATFVINPGFVYTEGLSAWAHYGISAMAGLICALIVLSNGFQKIGRSVDAVTLPDWMRKRYDSPAMGFTFAFLTLFYISFVVLILGGSAIIINGLFGIDYHWALVGVLVFVFGYVLMGGTYAHAYTNFFQGVLMVFIALIVFGSGWEHLTNGFGEKLAAIGTSFASWTNPDSKLYYDMFSVFISSFVITFALMLQPHILTKLLYIKDDKKVRRQFLAVAIVTALIFNLMLFAGFYAKFDGVVGSWNNVTVNYIKEAFDPYLVTFILITLLAAGMSTLDGILVSISSVVVADLVIPLSGNSEKMVEKGLSMSRYVLVAVGLVSLAIAWDAPKSLGLFAQLGIYGLVAAASPPLVVGILRPNFKQGNAMLLLAGLSIGMHFGLRFGLDIINPAVTAAWGVIAGVGIGFVLSFVQSGQGSAEVSSLRSQ